jgi:hypothetical protein
MTLYLTQSLEMGSNKLAENVRELNYQWSNQARPRPPRLPPKGLFQFFDYEPEPKMRIAGQTYLLKKEKSDTPGGDNLFSLTECDDTPAAVLAEDRLVEFCEQFRQDDVSESESESHNEGDDPETEQPTVAAPSHTISAKFRAKLRDFYNVK